MEYKWHIASGVVGILVSVGLFFVLRRKKKPCENREAQRLLNEYLTSSLTLEEIGRFYERYIGHLHEEKGMRVVYHGAVNGFDDLGRDLIITDDKETLIVQTKCWAKNKRINEKHIFQLYGSMAHYIKTDKSYGQKVKAVFYTTAKYSATAKSVADVLGVELRTQELNRNYPLIKCNVNQKGEKIYHLPFDPYYDKIRIDLSDDKFFVHTVDEAVARGFRRARTKTEEAA